MPKPLSGASPSRAEILGHKSLQMVKWYAHFTETYTTGVLQRMAPQMLDGPQEESLYYGRERR